MLCYINTLKLTLILHLYLWTSVLLTDTDAVVMVMYCWRMLWCDRSEGQQQLQAPIWQSVTESNYVCVWELAESEMGELAIQHCPYRYREELQLSGDRHRLRHLLVWGPWTMCVYDDDDDDDDDDFHSHTLTDSDSLWPIWSDRTHTHNHTHSHTCCVCFTLVQADRRSEGSDIICNHYTLESCRTSSL